MIVQITDTAPKRPAATVVDVAFMTQGRTCTPHAGRPPRDRTPADASAAHLGIADAVFEPWTLRVGRTSMLVRPAGPRDLHRVATLHGRCSARTLLDRYRAGGKGPAPAALERALRRPLHYVVTLPTGTVVALASTTADTWHAGGAAEIGVLVVDEWQGLGIGRELVAHAAAAAAVCGYTELVAYPGTTALHANALLRPIGTTRFVRDAAGAHLHSYLSESAALGLGPVREQLAS